MSDLLAMIKRHEGTGPVKKGRYFPYRDTVGKLTVGYGRNLDELGLSQEEIEHLLTNDVVRVFGEVRFMCPWIDTVDKVRQDALLDACLNLGLPKFLGFHDMLDAMKIGAYQAAAAALLDSLAAKQAPNRYHELAAMIEHGQYVVQV